MSNTHLALTALSLLIFGAALFSIDFQSIANAITLTTTAETLAAVGYALSLPSGNGKAVVKIFASVTAGTSTTAIVIKVYAGSIISGSPIATFTNNIPAAAGSPQFNFTHAVYQALSMATQAQYCFSVTQMAASANGSITAASIETELLSG